MNNNQDVISVGIYLYGDNLDPKYVSQTLGVEPTKSQKKGEVKTTGVNRESSATSGFWIKEFILKNKKTEEHLDDLSACLKRMRTLEISKIKNVEHAHLDVYVGTGIFNNSAQASFVISDNIMSILSKANIPLMITFCADAIMPEPVQPA